jgi:hypothetical protein
MWGAWVWGDYGGDLGLSCQVQYMWGFGLGGLRGRLGLELSGIRGDWGWVDYGGDLGLSCQVYVGLGLEGLWGRLGLELSHVCGAWGGREKKEKPGLT